MNAAEYLRRRYAIPPEMSMREFFKNRISIDLVIEWMDDFAKAKK